MKTMNPFTVLPAPARKWVYVAFSAIALVVACVDVGFSSAQVADPAWLTVTQDILTYLAVPVGVLAVSNMPTSSGEVMEAIQDERSSSIRSASPADDPSQEA